MPFKCNNLQHFLNSSQESLLSDKGFYCSRGGGWPKSYKVSETSESVNFEDVLSKLDKITIVDDDDDDDDDYDARNSCQKMLWCSQKKSPSKNNYSKKRNKFQINDINRECKNLCGSKKTYRSTIARPGMTMEDVKRKCLEIDSLNEIFQMGGDAGDQENEPVEYADKSVDCDNLCPEFDKYEASNRMPIIPDFAGENEQTPDTSLKPPTTDSATDNPSLGTPCGITSSICNWIQSFIQMFACLISVTPDECPCRNNNRRDSSDQWRHPEEKSEKEVKRSVEYEKTGPKCCPKGTEYFDDTDAFSFIVEGIWSFICRLFSGICSKKKSADKSVPPQKKEEQTDRRVSIEKEKSDQKIEQDNRGESYHEVEIKKTKSASLDKTETVSPIQKRKSTISEKVDDSEKSTKPDAKTSIKSEESKTSKKSKKSIVEQDLEAILEPLIEKEYCIPQTKLPALEDLDNVKETPKEKSRTQTPSATSKSPTQSVKEGSPKQTSKEPSIHKKSIESKEGSPKQTSKEPSIHKRSIELKEGSPKETSKEPSIRNRSIESAAGKTNDSQTSSPKTRMTKDSAASDKIKSEMLVMAKTSKGEFSEDSLIQKEMPPDVGTDDEPEKRVSVTEGSPKQTSKEPSIHKKSIESTAGKTANDSQTTSPKRRLTRDSTASDKIKSETSTMAKILKEELSDDSLNEKVKSPDAVTDAGPDKRGSVIRASIDGKTSQRTSIESSTANQKRPPDTTSLHRASEVEAGVGTIASDESPTAIQGKTTPDTTVYERASLGEVGVVSSTVKTLPPIVGKVRSKTGKVGQVSISNLVRSRELDRIDEGKEIAETAKEEELVPHSKTTSYYKTDDADSSSDGGAAPHKLKFVRSAHKDSSRKY